MSLTETFALVSFSLFSYADLRYRLVPGIEVFLLGTIMLTIPLLPFKPGSYYLHVFGASSAIYPVGSPYLYCSTHLSGRYCLQDMDIARASLAGRICLQLAVWLAYFPCQQSCYHCLDWNFGEGSG